MRTIKEGKMPEEKEYKVACRNCKTKFAFKRREAEYVTDFRDGDVLKIACPKCKQHAWVKP